MVRSLRQGQCTPHELASPSRENNIVQGVTRFSTWAKRGGIWTDARVCLHYWVVIRVAGYCNHPSPPYIAQFLGYVMGRIHMALRSYSFLDISLPPIISWDQAALWMVQSVCLPVCLSVSHTILTMFPSGVITNDRSDIHAKGQDQRSKVKVTEVTTQLNRFRTVTPVWIHVW